jgi:hypothetical protein
MEEEDEDCVKMKLENVAEEYVVGYISFSDCKRKEAKLKSCVDRASNEGKKKGRNEKYGLERRGKVQLFDSCNSVLKIYQMTLPLLQRKKF